MTKATCQHSIPASVNVAAAGGRMLLEIENLSNSDCAWRPVSGDPTWLAIIGSGSAGSGIVTYLVQANPTSQPRSTTISVAGHTVAINQAGAK